MNINPNNVTLKISAGNTAQFLKDPLPQIVFSGRSNVGKSSLINTLLNRKKLARVSAAPGKTVTINFYEIDRKLYFVDLPGYGYASRSATLQAEFSKLTDDYFMHNPAIDRVRLVVQLVDSRVGPTADDLQMLDFLVQRRIPFVVAATKVDKLSKNEASLLQEKLREALGGMTVLIIPFSSVSGEGKASLWNKIAATAGL
ncbi:MAG: ribosome biogenesis GTP-binding protein YihA/YsxC [Eubacteriales bacterium]